MFILEVAFLISKGASGMLFVQCKMLQCLNSLILTGFWEQWFKYNAEMCKQLRTVFSSAVFSFPIIFNTSLYTMMWLHDTEQASAAQRLSLSKVLIGGALSGSLNHMQHTLKV
jgi:hypothetical protein